MKKRTALRVGGINFTQKCGVFVVFFSPLSGSVKDLISFLFMCVLTLAGAEKKKTAVPRCSEAAVGK